MWGRYTIMEDYVFLPVRWVEEGKEGARSLMIPRDKRPAASDEANAASGRQPFSGCVTGVTELLVSRTMSCPAWTFCF